MDFGEDIQSQVKRVVGFEPEEVEFRYDNQEYKQADAVDLFKYPNDLI